MKGFLLAVVLVSVCSLLNACEKSASNGITGRWNILSDSTITTGPLVSYAVFYGTKDDCFIFSSDGSLQIKEGSSINTNTYQIISADTLLLPGIGVSINSVTEPSVFTIGGSTLRIVANPPGNIITPGHQYQRIIDLRK